MRRGAVILGFSALSLIGAACGKPFAYGTGGAGGAGGAGAGGPGGGSASSSVTASSSSGSGIGEACKVGSTDCRANQYCATTDCKQGTCQLPPAPMGQSRSPVCGCDGITYWNADLAIEGGVAFLDDLHCDTSKLLACDVLLPGGNPCDHGNDVFCSVQPEAACGGKLSGTCVKLPESCEGTAFGGIGCLDATNTCQLACKIIRNEKPWYVIDPPCTPK